MHINMYLCLISLAASTHSALLITIANVNMVCEYIYRFVELRSHTTMADSWYRLTLI